MGDDTVEDKDDSEETDAPTDSSPESEVYKSIRQDCPEAGGYMISEYPDNVSVEKYNDYGGFGCSIVHEYKKGRLVVSLAGNYEKLKNIEDGYSSLEHKYLEKTIIRNPLKELAAGPAASFNTSYGVKLSDDKCIADPATSPGLKAPCMTSSITGHEKNWNDVSIDMDATSEEQSEVLRAFDDIISRLKGGTL
jgi:hypothetical protein